MVLNVAMQRASLLRELQHSQSKSHVILMGEVERHERIKLLLDCPRLLNDINVKRPFFSIDVL